MKAHELTGAALDWTVAIAEGYGKGTYMRYIDFRFNVHGKVSCMLVPIDSSYVMWSPSTKWEQAGHIIEREGIAVWRDSDGWIANFPGRHRYKGNVGYIDVDDVDGVAGPTPLVAAMRAYAESKFGFDIDIPKGLL